jgi:hypothetical protein
MIVEYNTNELRNKRMDMDKDKNKYKDEEYDYENEYCRDTGVR